ncbi:type 2 lanthipeptide synthetase LanM family protein [Streptomyces sp. CB01881]|uniref:type 2 lanthipeptide synthetase LanM family protein n=1 Tax=Streptomyces sp. CB01881 TaxID=2078691 RepID=UPI001386C570|nr:type 2 lanthipeptide synthetase LanM family protein [Streptomyces sp. CB01881]
MIDTWKRSAAAPGVATWWLRALPGAERAGAVRPDWAAFVDEVVAGPPSGAFRPAAGELSWDAGFVAILAPFAERAAQRLPDRHGEGAAVRAAFVRRLARALARRCARVLVLELHGARAAGGLRGGTPSERFDSFVESMKHQASLAALFTTYPVLGRVIGQSCLHAVAALDELLGRFAADRAEIVATLLRGVDPGDLLRVDTGAGDGHRRGRTVAVLRFADGRRVVYKPRPLQAHRYFNDVLEWFNARPGTPGLPVLALLDRGAYGWVEYITHRPCETRSQLDRFYRRQGSLLALLYALEGTDLHFENLVARGDEPALIDVETLFHPPPAARADDPAALALRSSVYRIGLLPHLLLGDREAMDVSGLGGDPGAPLPMDGVEWADPGTDRMRLVRRPQTLAGAANRPGLAGGRAEPAAHTEALVAGFAGGYRAIAAGRRELLGPQGMLSSFADTAVRVVVRPTQIYTTLLTEATHPDALRDAAEREALFGLLGTDESAGPGHPGALAFEIAQLRDGDVPLFTTTPGSVDLWSGGGERIAGALDRSGLDRAAERIRGMGEADLAAQQWIIRAAMAARSTAAAHGPAAREPEVDGPAARTPAVPVSAVPGGPGPEAVDPERLLGAARRIGDRLVELAHQGPARTNWLGLDLVADRYWQLRPCGADLGGGYPGVALFLAQLAALTGDDRYADTAARALQPLPAVLERLAARPEDLAAVGPGGFAGLGGIAYAVTMTAAALDDPQLAALTGPATALTVRAAETGTAPGIADGLAGGLAALLAVHRVTGSEEARRGARACADRLAARRLPPGPGFATGAAGIGWALLRFAAATGDAGHESAGLTALRAAAERLSTGTPATEKPATERLPTDGPPARDSWCRGPAGLALAIAGRPVAADGPWPAEITARAAGAGSRTPTDHSLCHGELGVLEVLAHRTDPVAPTARNHRTHLLLAALDRYGPRCGTPAGLVAPGLLTGLAGIGHGLLRLGFADRTPSALLLAPTP